MEKDDELCKEPKDIKYEGEGIISGSKHGKKIEHEEQEPGQR